MPVEPATQGFRQRYTHQCSGPTTEWARRIAPPLVSQQSRRPVAIATFPSSPSEVPMKPGLLIVERENWFESPSYGATEEAAATPAVPVPLGEVWRTYRGIDGIPWPSSQDTDELILSGGVASLDQYGAVVGVLGRDSQAAKVDLLYIRPSQSRGFLARVPKEFSFIGFDVGYVDGDFNCFSVLLNEVIFGSLPAMRQLSDNLNEYLLLPSEAAARTVVDVRNMFSRDTPELEDLEEGEGPFCIEVHLWGQ